MSELRPAEPLLFEPLLFDPPNKPERKPPLLFFASAFFGLDLAFSLKAAPNELALSSTSDASDSSSETDAYLFIIIPLLLGAAFLAIFFYGMDYIWIMSSWHCIFE